MVDKIRSNDKGELTLEYEVNLGKGFDAKCLTFLRVRFEAVIDYVNLGLTEGAILESCFGMGHGPTEGEIYMWNEFMRKRGWNDDLSQTLERGKKRKPCFPGRRYKQCSYEARLMELLDPLTRRESNASPL